MDDGLQGVFSPIAHGVGSYEEGTPIAQGVGSYTKSRSMSRGHDFNGPDQQVKQRGLAAPHRRGAWPRKAGRSPRLFLRP